MKKIIIHIGQYKTGSTSIQKMMWAARKELQENGVLYPQSYIRDGAHFGITDLLRKEFRNAGEYVDLNQLREEIERSVADTVVISCESLSGATVRRFSPDMMSYMWRRLATLFNGFNVRILFYARRQDESIDSRIIQEIKGQARKSRIDYEPFLYTENSLNYHYFYGLLEQIFGPGKVDVRLYERSYLTKGDVRNDFLDYLGQDDSHVPIPGSEENVSPSAKLVGYYRILNSLKLDVNDYALLTSGIWKELCTNGSPKAVALGRKERIHIMRFFAESNKRFISECVSDKEKDAYFQVFGRETNTLESNVFIDGVEAWEIMKRKGFDMVRRADRGAV